MRLIFAGTPEIAIPSLSLLWSAGHEVVAVLTRPDAARGRSGRPRPSPVAEWAAEHGIPVLKPARPRGDEFVATLKDLRPDACPVVAYGALLPEEVLAVPLHGWVNLHFSLLPRWRGAAPAQRTIIAGDEVAGATTFRIVHELDAGPIYGSIIEPLDGTETAGLLLDKLADEGAHLLLDTVNALPDAVPIEQSTDGLTLAPKLSVAEAHVDWTRDGSELDRLIRGCSPEPMAWTTLEGERVGIALARPLQTHDLQPGALRLEKRRAIVGTGTVDLELVRVQPQGKKEMSGADWGRGLRLDAPAFDGRDA